MSSNETAVEATSTPTSDLSADESMRSMTMSTIPEPLRHMMLERLPVREKMEMLPLQEMIDKLPVQEVIERLPQRFRPEPPKRSKKKPILLGLLVIAGIVAFVMMKRRRGAEGDASEADTGLVSVGPASGVGIDESASVGASGSLR